MSEKKNILVTGGAGFIGSHTCIELLEAGYGVVVVDDLSNSSEVALDRVRSIVADSAAAGKAPADAVDGLKFYELNILDREALSAVFEENKIDAVIHFAGYKAVGESVEKPLEYYHNNLTGTFVLCDVMREHGCKSIVFSSSATVYGEPESVPLSESAEKKPATNPYGWTKWMIEQILTDLHTADPEWDVVLLRYFNPIGAHESGLIGEDPKGIPNNLVPYVAQVAVGKLAAVRVFGDDYPTPDGTGVRDFIHVMDLADGHAKAVPYIMNHTGWIAINLGCGRGYSVLEVVKAFEKASDRSVPYELVDRREGDIAANWCDPARAERLLGWKASRTIDDMCRDAWNFESNKR